MKPEVTALLLDWDNGREGAFDDLVPLVYDELRRLASLALRREGEGHTLRTTALVHEAYLKLVGADVGWEDSGHFMRVAARAMRRVLVDHARKRLRQKRGGGLRPIGLDTLKEVLPGEGRPELVIELDEAMERLMTLEERKGRVVELHYFGGLSYDEIARTLEISSATVHRDLRMARAWLYRELGNEEGSE
ncbi:MAG: sigma-70 family RNA polymerase sigma factor [Gemmatimonadota bacterium]